MSEDEKLYNTLGQHHRAIQDMDEATRLDPGFGVAYNNRGLAYDHPGQYQRAIRYLDETVKTG